MIPINSYRYKRLLTLRLLHLTAFKPSPAEIILGRGDFTPPARKTHTKSSVTDITPRLV
jgi:hypothetical protein